MGHASALGFAEQVGEGNISLRAALHYHLTANHYPPHPAFMVEVAERAVVLASRDDWDEEIDLPLGCTDHTVLLTDENRADHADCPQEPVVQWRDREDGKVSVSDVIESFRLDAFVTDTAPRCPACGDTADYCQGHGEIGDPVGRAVLQAHYEDDKHDDCHPAADCK